MCFLYKACIFDLDGTLANTLESIAYYSNKALKQHGYRTIPVEQYRNIVGNGSAVQIRRMLLAVCRDGKYTEKDAASLHKTYKGFYAADPVFMVKNYPGMEETVATLKKMGIKTAVLSNKPHEWVTAIIGKIFPKGSFEVCMGQTSGLPLKPAPDGAFVAAEKLGVEPSLCLYIGDTHTDMETGLAAGMDTAGVLWGFRDRKELTESHAKYIIEKPENILDIVSGKRK